MPPSPNNLEHATAALGRARTGIAWLHRGIQGVLVALGALAAWGIMGDVDDRISAASIGLVLAGLSAAVYLEATAEFHAAQVGLQLAAQRTLDRMRGITDGVTDALAGRLHRALWGLRTLAGAAAALAVWMIIERSSPVPLATGAVLYILATGVLPTLVLIHIERLAGRIRRR